MAGLSAGSSPDGGKTALPAAPTSTSSSSPLPNLKPEPTTSLGPHDYFCHGLLGQAPVEHSPLRPNDIRRVEYDLPAVSSVSPQQQRLAAPDRFERGDHSVVGVEVGAVVLDDGTVAGRDVRPVLGFVLDRYARAASLSRLIGRVESSERAGSLKQLLEGSLEFLEQGQQVLATAIVAGPEPVTPWILNASKRPC